MDITQELPNFNLANDYGSNIVEDIKRQQQELSKKLHIFSIVSFMNELEDKIGTKFFERNGIHFIKIMCEHEYDVGYILSFESLNKSKITISPTYSNGGYTKEALFLRDIFNKIKGINYNFTTRELTRSSEIILSLEPGISEKILDLFLNEDLKKVYQYNKMKVDLPESTDNNSKKLKV